MNNKNYEIRDDFLEGQEVLIALSDADREKVKSAITLLATDPWPRQYSAKPLREKAAKITVPVEDDEIAVLYDVDVYLETIDLIRIKKRGRYKKAGEWLSGLLNFEP